MFLLIPFSYGGKIRVKTIFGSGVTVDKYPQKKTLLNNYLPENNYSPSTYLLVIKCYLQEISTPLK